MLQVKEEQFDSPSGPSGPSDAAAAVKTEDSGPSGPSTADVATDTKSVALRGDYPFAGDMVKASGKVTRLEKLSLRELVRAEGNASTPGGVVQQYWLALGDKLDS